MATILDTLVTDRTWADVEAGNEKGIYRAEDLNRVESAVEYVAGLLAEVGFRADIEAKPNWEMQDVPTQGQMERYLTNLRNICSALPLPANTPGLPADMVLLTYEDANNIERVLLAVADAVSKISSTYRHCGAPVCGLEDLIL